MKRLSKSDMKKLIGSGGNQRSRCGICSNGGIGPFMSCIPEIDSEGIVLCYCPIRELACFIDE